MSAELFELDVQAGIAMAWHGLTKVVPVVTRQVAFPYELRRVKLNTTEGAEAVQKSLSEFVAIADSYANKGGKGLTKASIGEAGQRAKNALDLLEKSSVPGFTVFVASDNDGVIGKPMADTYQALSNEEFWNLCDEALKGTGAVIESAGTLNNRARRFLTIKLDDSSTEIGGREFKNRISMIDSIDGTSYFHAVNTSICVVCANTARAAIGDMTGEFRFKLKHTKNFHARIEDMEKTIESMVGVQAQFNAALSIAASEPLAEGNARNLFAGWIGTGAEKLSTRAVNTVDRLTGLYRGGAGNNGETLLDGVSAVTDFYSHESSGGEEKAGFRWKQFQSSEFGAGNRAKTDFLSSLFLTEKGRVNGLNRQGIAEMQSRGGKLLADYAKAN